jgi:hypothetical protein
VADPNYLIPAITAGATVGAAVISGFFAAALKHRWDVKDTYARWERERSERRREELKAAFNAYLAGRIEMETILSFPQLDAEAGRNAFTGIHLLSGHFTQLTVMLDNEHAAVVKADFECFGGWINGVFERESAIVAGKSHTDTAPSAPTDEPVRKLAKCLLDLGSYAYGQGPTV